MQIKHSTQQQFNLGTYFGISSDINGIVSLSRKNLFENSSFEFDNNPADTGNPPDNIAWLWNIYKPGGITDTYIPLLDMSLHTSGTKSQKLTYTSVSGKELFFGQAINVIENTDYSFSTDVLIDDPINFTVVLKVEFRRLDDTYISGLTSNAIIPTSFIRMLWNFKTPLLTARVRLWICLKPNVGVTLPITGSIWIDSAQFELGNIPTTYVEKYNYNHGEYVSSPINVPELNSHKLEITSSVPTDTYLKLQIRSATSLQLLQSSLWYGPTSQTDYYEQISTVPTELISNPGFEIINPTNILLPNNWWTYTTGGTSHKLTYPEPGRIGGSSVSIEYITTSGYSALWGYNVNIDITKKYKLSGWIKTQNIIGTGARIGIDWKSATANLSSNTVVSNITGSTDWLYFEGIVTPNPLSNHGSIVLSLNNATGKVWFDDISFKEVTNVTKEWSMNPIHKNDSYIQYKILFDTNNDYNSPSVYDIRINYSLPIPEIHDIELSSISKGISYSFYPGETINFKIEVVNHSGINNIGICNIKLIDNLNYSYNIPLIPDIIIDNNRRYYICSFTIPTGSVHIGTWEAIINIINSNQIPFSESVFLKIRDNYNQIPQQMKIGILQAYQFNASTQTNINNAITSFTAYRGVDIWKLSIRWSYLEYKRGEYDINYVNAIIQIMNAAQLNSAKFQLGIAQQNFPDWVNNGKWDTGSRYTTYYINKYLTETWKYLSSQIMNHPAFDSYLIINEENNISTSIPNIESIYIKSNSKVVSIIKSIDKIHRVTIRPNTTESYVRTVIGNNGNHDYDYGTGTYPTGAQWFGIHEDPISYTSYMTMSVRFRHSPLIFNSPGGIGEIGLFSSTAIDEHKLIALERSMSIAYDNGYTEFQIWEGSFSFSQPQLYIPRLLSFRNSLLKRSRLSRFNVRILNDVVGDGLIQHPTLWNVPYFIDVNNEQYYNLIRKLDELGYSWFYTITKADPLQPQIYDTTITLSEIKGQTVAAQNILITTRLQNIISAGRIKTWSLTPTEPIEILCPQLSTVLTI